MTAGELRQRYQEVGGDEARSRNREYLVRRILWMLQARVYGGLRERAVALAGPAIARRYKGETLRVTVLADGFERATVRLRFPP
jgi:hypothetical protein